MSARLNKQAREFLSQQEATKAARSKAAKKAKRQRIAGRFSSWLVEKAEKIEANGNPAGAAAFRKFWGEIAHGRYARAINRSTQPSTRGVKSE